MCDLRHGERMEVYVLLRLRDCPSLKGGGARGSRQLVLPVLVSHSNRGRKKGRRMGRLQSCMLAGSWETQLLTGVGEEDEEAAGLSCPLVCTEVLMTLGQAPSKGAHCWAAVFRLVWLTD